MTATRSKTRAGRQHGRRSKPAAPAAARPARRPAAPPVSVLERDRRVAEIAAWLCDGLSAEDIRTFVSTPECDWPIRPAAAQLDSWMADAFELIGRNPVHELPQELGVSIRRLNDLYHKCLRIQEYKTALAVEKVRQELLGLRGQVDFHANPQDQTTAKEASEDAKAAASHRT